MAQNETRLQTSKKIKNFGLSINVMTQEPPPPYHDGSYSPCPSYHWQGRDQEQRWTPLPPLHQCLAPASLAPAHK